MHKGVHGPGTGTQRRYLDPTGAKHPLQVLGFLLRLFARSHWWLATEWPTCASKTYLGDTN